ncbi:MAG: hypothetical protein QOJ62_913 [Actinomycetota bacterium]|nr:hypothetical protein [Actinomycetota bacterium]
MVDIVVIGRHIDIPARLRAHAVEKLAKVEKLCPKAIQVTVEVSRERNPRQAELCDRVELTCFSRGPVIRGEASADDMIAAFDLAWDKLESRLVRAADRRRVHRGARTPVSVATATKGLAAPAEERPSRAADDDEDLADPYASGGAQGPMLVREKLHAAVPMTLDQALYEMELVGHAFFLFADKDSGLPSVVYRRRAYDYGVIRIDTSGADASSPPTPAAVAADQNGRG